MKKLFAALLASCFVSSAALAAPAEIVFCENFNDQFEPVNVNTEFEGVQASWFAVLDEPIGQNNMVITLYQNNLENGSQELLDRATIPVNPRWNAYGARNGTFPGVGSYELAIETEDGQTLASGTVLLKEASAPIEEKPEERVGTSLQELFNRYAPK